jgi:Spy/CpxP family protein refolding chaperone
MVKKICVVMFLAAQLFGVAAVNAAPHDSCTADAATKDSSHQKWIQQLNLSTDQKAKMKALREEMQTMRKSTMEKMKSLRDKSRDELLKAAPNKMVLYGYAKEIGDLHKAMSEQMADHMLKVKGILSKEQFEKMMSRDFLKGIRDKKIGGPKTGKPYKMHGQGPGGPHDPDDDD